MAISPQQRQAIQVAAEAWAQTRGFASASAVPMGQAGELWQSVAGTTKLPAAEVRDALLAAASGQNESAKTGVNKLGIEGGYQGAAGGKPIRAGGQLGAVAAWMDAQAQRAAHAGEAKTEKTSLSELQSLDKTFEQTAKDFQATRLAITTKAQPKTLDELYLGGIRLLSAFRQLEGKPQDRQLREEIIVAYKDLLSKAARDKGVFLTKAQSGAPKEFEIEAPSTPAAPEPAARAEKYAELGEKVVADGTPVLDPERKAKLGEVSSVGVDATSGQAFVYDFHGQVEAVLTVEDLVAARKLYLDEHTAVAKKLLAKGDSIESLRSVSDKGLERLSGEVAFVSLLEDDGSQLARVYPTKWHKAQNGTLRRRMICDGPFKGVFLDDLVNRLAANGPAYAFDPKGGKAGLPSTPKQGEPLVTTAKVMERGEKREKLYVHVPFDRAYTEVRQSMRRLSELIPEIKYEEGTKNCGFYFDSTHYGAVRDVLRGMVLSGPAKAKLETYFDELTRVELAAADKNLGAHTAKAIGGFRDSVKGPTGVAKKVELSYWQKKSLAWLEARDWKGVISLDTGMGKTMMAIGAMLELQKRHDEKRPMLVVCPPALRGNFAKEVIKFLDEDTAKQLLSKLVVLSYPDFAKAVKSGTHDGKPFAPEKFGAAFFDEAQWLKSPGSSRSRAAMSFDHPRKICLTASPMENSPMEAYVLACVANNVNLRDKVEGKEHRYKMRKFKDLYCETLGGRILGVKQRVELLPKVFIDPKHALYTWVRSNVFFADKRIDDTKLPELKLTTDVLEMPKAMEDQYRKTASKVGKVMRGMVSMYRDKGILKEYVDDKGRTRREINPLARDKRIAQMFGVKFRGVIGELNDLGNTPEKIGRAAELILKRLEAKPSSRAILFSDSQKYVMESARTLSNEIPGKLHAAALGGEIRIFQNGQELKEIAGHKLPFKPGEYRRDPSAPPGPENRAYPAADWQQFVLNEIVGKDAEIATTTLFGPVYQQGQNLQWADTGVHLDRDTWNRENTKQREARLWRKGQTETVQFYNVDWVYKKPKDDFDRTLDEVRKYHELVAEALFHDIIEVPQKTVELGEEWSPVRDADTMRYGLELVELGLDPSLATAAKTGVH